MNRRTLLASCVAAFAAPALGNRTPSGFGDHVPIKVGDVITFGLSTSGLLGGDYVVRQTHTHYPARMFQ